MVVAWLVLAWLVLAWLVLAWLVLAWLVLAWLVLAWLVLAWGGGGFLRTLSGTGGMHLNTALRVLCRCRWATEGRG